jgi:glycosyltransferase involved in cell wall biosynthesis
LLVDPGDTSALADALVRLLSDPVLAERLAAGARAAGDRWLQTPGTFARRVRELIDTMLQ